jgi:hypothetical protein
MRFDPVRSVVPSMRVWGASSHGYSFCITQEMMEGDPEWSGFTASWKNESHDMLPFGKQPSNMIEGGPWRHFSDAEWACVQVLKKLRAKQ